MRPIYHTYVYIYIYIYIYAHSFGPSVENHIRTLERPSHMAEESKSCSLHRLVLGLGLWIHGTTTIEAVYRDYYSNCWDGGIEDTIARGILEQAFYLLPRTHVMSCHGNSRNRILT